MLGHQLTALSLCVVQHLDKVSVDARPHVVIFLLVIYHEFGLSSSATPVEQFETVVMPARTDTLLAWEIYTA